VTRLDTSTLSDRVGGRGLLLTGVGFLIAADIVLATAGSVWQMVGGAALWGLHMGATQGLLSALVVDGAPHDLRHRLQVLQSDHWWGFLAASVLAGCGRSSDQPRHSQLALSLPG
jgi:MFS family permease